MRCKLSLISWGKCCVCLWGPRVNMKSHLLRLCKFILRMSPLFSHLEIDRSLKFSNQKLQRSERERDRQSGAERGLRTKFHFGKPNLWESLLALADIFLKLHWRRERNELNLPPSSVRVRSAPVFWFMPILIGLVFSRCKFDCRHFAVHTHARCRIRTMKLFHYNRLGHTLRQYIRTSVDFHLLHPRSLSLSLFPHCPNKSPSSALSSLMFRKYLSQDRLCR